MEKGNWIGIYWYFIQEAGAIVSSCFVFHERGMEVKEMIWVSSHVFGFLALVYLFLLCSKPFSCEVNSHIMTFK